MLFMTLLWIVTLEGFRNNNVSIYYLFLLKSKESRSVGNDLLLLFRQQKEKARII